MFSLRLIACVLAAVCGAFLTLTGVWLSYESYTHNQPVTGFVFGCVAAVGLMGMYGAAVFYYSIAYDRGWQESYENGVDHCWREVVKTLFQNGHSCVSIVELRHHLDATIRDAMNYQVPPDTPLVKLGQGDYERHIMPPTGKITEEAHLERSDSVPNFPTLDMWHALLGSYEIEERVGWEILEFLQKNPEIWAERKILFSRQWWG